MEHWGITKTIQEDAAITKLVDEHGIEDWTRIADMLG